MNIMGLRQTKRAEHMEYVVSILNNLYCKLQVNHWHADKLGGLSYITFEEHNAINLTIRYLEAQKGEKMSEADKMFEKLGYNTKDGRSFEKMGFEFFCIYCV